MIRILPHAGRLLAVTFMGLFTFTCLSCSGGSRGSGDLRFVGRVLEAVSGAPVVEAAVTLLESGDSAMTDDTGTFSLVSQPVTGNVELLIEDETLQARAAVHDVPEDAEEVSVHIEVVRQEQQATTVEQEVTKRRPKRNKDPKKEQEEKDEHHGPGRAPHDDDDDQDDGKEENRFDDDDDDDTGSPGRRPPSNPSRSPGKPESSAPTPPERPDKGRPRPNERPETGPTFDGDDGARPSGHDDDDDDHGHGSHGPSHDDRDEPGKGRGPGSERHDDDDDD